MEQADLKPLLELQYGVVKSRESSFRVVCNFGNKKCFMYIDTTTNRINNFHAQPPFIVEEDID